jgi:hypothetical protein
VGDASRHRLGDWTCPSGNNVVAFIVLHSPDQAELRMEWDTPPPLAPQDERHYTDVIRPAMTALAAEYMERPARRALVLEL